MSDQITLCYKPKREEGDAPVVSMENMQVVSHQGRVFDDILRLHSSGHAKGKALRDKVTTRHGRSIPQWVQEIFIKCCPVCTQASTRVHPPAGHTPIITRGFGSRGQFDLIDMQSNPDGDFKFLGNYQDHGIKLYDNMAFTSKSNKAIAAGLFDLFTRIGPPKILQTDNGTEMSGHANMGGASEGARGGGRGGGRGKRKRDDVNDASDTSGQSKNVRLTDEDMLEIISEVKQLWPGCKMVHGRPRHSQSQGGVERLNRTVEAKLSKWCKDNKSNHWATVGRMMVRWQVNTEQTSATGQMPYESTYGQKPKVGISDIPLEPELLESLSTEAELLSALGSESAHLEDVTLSAASPPKVLPPSRAGGAKKLKQVIHIFCRSSSEFCKTPSTFC